MTAKRAKKRFAEVDQYTPSNTFSKMESGNTLSKKTEVTLVPRSIKQQEFFNLLGDHTKDIIIAHGPAGTGKTFLPCHYGIKLFFQGKIDKIIVTRPAVSVDENHGFLPGTLEEKMAPWTRPIFDVFMEYFFSHEIEGMISEGIIEICPLAYMRGRTFKHALILADEMQLSTERQMKMLLTRIGEGSKIVVTGDVEQCDRGFDSNGLSDFLKRFTGQSSRIATVQFTQQDVERHAVIKDVLDLYADLQDPVISRLSSLKAV